MYVLIGNKRLLLRLDRSRGEICLFSVAICSSVMYRTLSELCLFGVLTRELCTINCDDEPKMIKSNISIGKSVAETLKISWKASHSELHVQMLTEQDKIGPN